MLTIVRPADLPAPAVPPSLGDLDAIRARVAGWRHQLAEAARAPGYPFRAAAALRVLERTGRTLAAAARVHRALS